MVGEQVVERIQHLRDPQILDLGGMARELFPKIAQHLLVVEFAGRNLVELLFEPGREAELDIAGKEALEKGGDEAAAVFGHERPLFEPHIVAVLEHRQSRSVGGRPADAELFHLLDQAGFGVAGRRLGEMLLDIAGLERRLVTGFQRRQFAAVFVLRCVRIAIFLGFDAVEGKKARKGHDRADGAQHDGPARGTDVDVGGGALDLGGPHLTGQRPPPDQPVNLLLVGIEVQRIGMPEHVGGANRLVRFLGVLRLGLVDTRGRGEVGGAEFLLDRLAGLGDGFRRHLHGVGSHVGDDAVFIEALGDLHRPVRGQPQPRGGILLQARSGERRIRVALGRLLVDALDHEPAGIDRLLQSLGFSAGLDVELVGGLAVH